MPADAIQTMTTRLVYAGRFSNTTLIAAGVVLAMVVLRDRLVRDPLGAAMDDCAVACSSIGGRGDGAMDAG